MRHVWFQLRDNMDLGASTPKCLICFPSLTYDSFGLIEVCETTEYINTDKGVPWHMCHTNAF